MKNIAIYTLTSALHDEQAIGRVTQEFLSSLNIDYDFCGANYDGYGQHALDLIYVRTGGTECILKPLLPQLQQASKRPILLLTSGKSNSLAASMEILSYLRQQGIKGEILHGSTTYIQHRIKVLAKVAEARQKLQGKLLGIIGNPSDWLISSTANAEVINERLGIELVNIPMHELLDCYANLPAMKDGELEAKAPTEGIRQSLSDALRIYESIKTIVKKHNLQGITIRCFDLLSAVHNTGCIALARLNSEGLAAGCEGDVPALLSMMLTQAVTGVSGFQANPARINPETGEMLFAHCTIPFNMVERYELDTHFESGIGVGIRGYMHEGPVTVFKVSGDLSRHLISEGTLLRNQGEPDLCRTQQIIRLSNASDARYFLTNPIGNHHIIIPGQWKEVLEELLAQ